MENQVVAFDEELDSTSDCEGKIIIDQEKAHVSIPNGTQLGDTFSIRRKVESLKYGDIYDVTHVAMTEVDMETRYQARAFQTHGLLPKVEAHIRRTIRRMSRRTVLRTTWGQLEVVIFKAENLDRSESNNPVQAKSGGSSCPPPPEPASPKRTKKTSAKRKESERLRQQSRRKRNLQRKQTQNISPQNKSIQTEQGFGPSLLLDIDPDDIIFLHRINHITSFRSLWTSWDLKQYLEARCKQTAPSAVESLSDMIRHEEVYLYRQRNKFTAIVEKCTKYISENRDAKNHGLGVMPCVSISQELKARKILFLQRYMILLSGLGALDAILVWPGETASISRLRSVK
ncbi:hypothetical protein FVEG_17428 [Fusarium verticillioides 7600]|uniref:Uncharacterized protein n=2 Tax=Gibberella moniliformis (strain M3125 / FGSC 7600) TaxID=334819 RepID=W7NFA1_GIBM7|nr:hypothetical protein FVEG_17428 [Fusarium verticillioides 7600]EWG54942.1 hypothetical protein FVEG_17428 [Fusarium verticillioides 7600]